MRLTSYHISKMDCPAEEQLIRMQLEPIKAVRGLAFDLDKRELGVYTDGDAPRVEAALHILGLGERLLGRAEVEAPIVAIADDQQRRTLWWVLGINAAFFVIELVAGLMAGSTGLVADSLDMFADAAVYALALLVVGAAMAKKKRVARISGYIELGLALIGFAEVGRRAVGFGESPDAGTMIIVATLALVANVVCLLLLRRGDRSEVHMQASYIFTSNDIVVNGGVILAGVMVYFTQSRLPDLVIGAIVFTVVLSGAVRILRRSLPPNVPPASTQGTE